MSTTVPTQVKHSWRATVRTVFQAAIGIAALAAPTYTAITHHEAVLAGGFLGAAFVVTATVTKVMNTPAVEEWIAKFIPFLATQPSTPTV